MLKVLKLGVIGSLRSVESVKPNGMAYFLGFQLPLGLTLSTLLRLPITPSFNTFNTS